MIKLKTLFFALIGSLLTISSVFAIDMSLQELSILMNENLGGTVLYPYGGGTGTSSNPSYGQLLVGNSGGTYTLTATSSLGFSFWDELSDMTLAQGNIYVGNASNNPEATSSLNILGDQTVVFETKASTSLLHIGQAYSETGNEGIGDIWWNSDDETLNVKLTNSVTGQMFHELYFDVKNQTGSQIDDMTPVFFAGSLGASERILVEPALASTTAISSYTVGIATEDIPNGGDGKITWLGKVRGIDTSGTPYGESWSDGDLIYISTSTAGYLTNVKPNAPYPAIEVAAVIYADSVNGILEVRPTWNDKLVDLADVNGTPLTTNGQMLVWNNDNSYFDFNSNLYALPSGYVGIGTTTPSYELSVNGDIYANGDFLGDGSNLTLNDLTLSGATYATLNDYITFSASAGRISGGVITDNGDGTVAVSAGSGSIRSSDSSTAQIYSFNWVASSSITIATTAITYIGIDYNSGSPKIVTSATDTWTETDKFSLGLAVREALNGDFLMHILNNPHDFGDNTAKTLHRLYETRKFEYAERVGGGVIGESGTRNLTLTACEFYDRDSEFEISAKDTSATDYMTIYYRDGSGGWNVSTSTTWDNTNYDDGTGTLNDLTAQRIGVHHVYQDMEDEAGSLILIYGRGDYVALATALQEAEPTKPLRVSSSARYIGLIAFQKSASTLSGNISKLTTSSGGGVAVSDHGNLAGLTDDDHTQYVLSNGTRALTGNWGVGGYDITGIGTLSSSNLTVTVTATTTNLEVEGWLKDGDGDTGTAGQILSYDGTDLNWITSAVSITSIADLNALFTGESVASTTWAGGTSLITLGTVTTGTWQATAIDHERGGLEADVSAYSGLISITGGSTAEVNSISELNNLLVGESLASTTWTGSTSLVTLGTVTTGSTGAGFTVDLDSSTLTCTNCIDVSDNTNLTAGRSLTLTGDDVLADAELYTSSFEFVVATSSMATTSDEISFQVPLAFTITEVNGYCTGGTTTIALDERAEATPKTSGTDILDDAWEVGDYVSTTTFSNAGITAGNWVNLDIDGYFTGTPTRCYISIKGTKDD